jgi:hypothetical protein
MDLFRNLRLHWFNYMLKKRMGRKQVERHSMNFNRANRIGILFDATDLDNQVFVESYAQVLRKAGKKVNILAFINDKNEHNELPFKHFNLKHLSWYLHPNSDDVNEFMDTPFDILLCLHLNEVQSMEYVAALSKAHLRVGKYSENKTHCYDLMIDSTAETTLQHFISQVDKFLKIMN